MTKKKKPRELVVIGAGPGGYAAAFHAADLGKKVTLIDPRPKPGGVCLFHGCIPTKALLHAASVRQDAYDAARWGMTFDNLTIDTGKVRQWKDDVVRQLTDGLSQLGKMRDIEYIRGRASFVDTHTLSVSEKDKDYKLDFEKAVIATGARAAPLPGADFDHDRIMNAESALEIEEIPGELLVVGAGYIGLEMSVIYHALGSIVTIVELQSDIMPGLDRDLARVFKKLRKDLMEKARFGSTVKTVEKKNKKVTVTIENDKHETETLEVDKVLIAIGEVPNTEGLGLEKAGVKTGDDNFIPVNAYRQTSTKHIYAIGDVTGQPLLAHKATHEGRVAAEHAAGKKTAYEPGAIPAIVFTEPELAWVGLTEKEAEEAGRTVQVTRFPWGASGRAATLGQSTGLTKLICDPGTGRVLGAGFAGKNAGSLVPEATLAIEMGAVARDLELTIHPHPTLSETLMEAAEMVYGQPTHTYKKK